MSSQIEISIEETNNPFSIYNIDYFPGVDSVDSLKRDYEKRHFRSFPKSYRIDYADELGSENLNFVDEDWTLDELTKVYDVYYGSKDHEEYDDPDLADALIGVINECGGVKHLDEALEFFMTRKVWIGDRDELIRNELDNLGFPDDLWIFFKGDLYFYERWESHSNYMVIELGLGDNVAIFRRF